MSIISLFDGDKIRVIAVHSQRDWSIPIGSHGNLNQPIKIQLRQNPGLDANTQKHLT